MCTQGSEGELTPTQIRGKDTRILSLLRGPSRRAEVKNSHGIGRSTVGHYSGGSPPMKTRQGRVLTPKGSVLFPYQDE
jgi:hypothetical protein